MSFPCEWDVDFPIIRRPSVTKPKTTNRITKSVAPTSAIKGSDCSKPVNDTSGKVSITPFTSPEDLALRAVKMKDRENSDAGFTIITLKRKQSLKSGQYPSQQRLRWSKEREKVPSLDALSKGNSQAQVGGALSYTDTSRWSSNSAQDPHDLPVRAFMDEEEEGQFSLCGPIGKLVCQQLQHGNVVRVGTNGNYKG
ncbi:hypothetical protein MATL_G00025520 [Megalops atlanticus]|uniref:Uncharacterized protein n=1 Tax=Megalops atlanticus TaxID=7932 RepID=A0A9D3QD77_MEGAT|nr:hypothetical protein MATL_G00025520 [Megalops atlanticus]